MEDSDREMHKATCAKCGQECEVPFEPREGRDVYCNECFRQNRKPRKSFGRNRDFKRRDREMHKATCAKCKKECEVPFKPTEGRDVLCKDCYSENRKEEDFE